MSRQRRVGIDVDGVLADFLSPGLALLSKWTGVPYTPDHLQEWNFDNLIPDGRVGEFWEEMGAPGVCGSFTPYFGAVAGMKALQEVCDVYIVTSALHTGKTWTYERDNWLMRHFDIPRSRIVHTQAKYTFYGMALVDDKPLNIEQWATTHPGQLPVLWSQPYNEKATFPSVISSSIVRTNNWYRLHDMVREFKS